MISLTINYVHIRNLNSYSSSSVATLAFLFGERLAGRAASCFDPPSFQFCGREKVKYTSGSGQISLIKAKLQSQNSSLISQSSWGCMGGRLCDFGFL